MKSVVLSTTEAEYMALSEVVKELKLSVKAAMWALAAEPGALLASQSLGWGRVHIPVPLLWLMHQ